jgi:arabinofuranosyltransferase
MSRISALAGRGSIGETAQDGLGASRLAVSAQVIAVSIALLALLALAPLFDRSLTLDIGAEGPFRAPDETALVRRLAGVHEPEFLDGVSYRWTKGWARMVFPNGHQLGDQLYLRLRLCGCHPEGDQPVARLALDNRPLGSLPTSAGYRRYTILVPPGADPDAGSDLLVELRMPTTSYDGRPVGVRLDQVELWAAPAPALAWPSALALALAGALIALAAARLVRDRPARVVLLAGLLLGPALILGAYRHQELAPSAQVLAALWGVLLVVLARPARLALALPLVAIVLALPMLPQLLGGWLIDDAFISFRYAQQLVAGHGLVFNPGERVEGYTNFLWTIAMAGVLWLGGDPAYIARLVTLLIAQATVVLCFKAGTSILNSQFSMLHLTAPLLLATSGPFLLYSARGSGMETALFTLLLLGGVLAYLGRSRGGEGERGRGGDRSSILHPPSSILHPLGAGALLALAAMTRPEGLLVAAITVGHTLVSRRRGDAIALAGAFLAIFLPYYLWRFAYYGLPLPNTFYVKVGATSAQVERGWLYLADYWAAEGWAWAIGLGAILIVGITKNQEQRTKNREPRTENREPRTEEGEAAVGGRRSAVGGQRLSSRFTSHVSRFTSHPNTYLALVVLAYSGYIVAVGGDWLPGSRFVVPLVPLLVLLAQAGLAWLAQRGRWGAVLAGTLLALALLDHARHTLTTSAYDPSNRIWSENDVVARRREVGRWLRANTPPGTLVAVEAAGALPYYSRRSAIDILGLNDRHIASLDVPSIGEGKPGHEKTDIPYVLDRRPDIIPYFSAPYFYDEPRFYAEYAREEHDGPEGYTVILFRRRP